MGNMINPNTNKQGPIRVTEDDSHFLVEIHPDDRDRAKIIPGRRWDGSRVVWVYDKTPEIYNALVAEFKRDADTLEIGRPTSKPPPSVRQADPYEEEEEFGAEIPEEEFDRSALENIGEGQTQLQGEFVELRNALEGFSESFATQERILEDISASQKELGEKIQHSSKSAAPTEAPKVAEKLPDALDLKNTAHVNLLEHALKQAAYNTSERSPRFKVLIEEQFPLRDPLDFVSTTHERLKVELEKLVDNDNSSDASFYELVYTIKNQNLIHSSRDTPIKVIPILFNLNEIRNRLMHPRIKVDLNEKRSRSIIYLMNVGLIWPRITIDQGVDE